MSLINCDINYINCNLSHLKNYLTTFNLVCSIIGTTEIWGTLQNIDDNDISGYSHKFQKFRYSHILISNPFSKDIQLNHICEMLHLCI